jgi:hypothetical protein
MEMSLGSGLALACCSIVAPPAASPCALSICISVRSKMFLRSMSKNNIKTGVTWTLGGCRNSILIFVSDRILSGLAKKLVQIPDSLDVLP